MSVTPLPEGYGLTRAGDLRYPFAPNTVWTLSGRFVKDSHTGIDWETCVGTPVHAMAAGYVVEVVSGFTYGDDPKPQDIANGYANRVVVHTGGYGDQPLVGFEHIYAHLAEVHVCKGQLVAAGDLLGVTGDTGWSSAPHLHVEVRPFGTAQPPAADPHGLSRRTTDDWHGHTLYKGAIDFKDFLPSTDDYTTHTIHQGCPKATVSKPDPEAPNREPIPLRKEPWISEDNILVTDLPYEYTLTYKKGKGSEEKTVNETVNSFDVIGRSEYFVVPPRGGNGPPGITFWWHIVAPGKGIGWVNDTSLITVTNSDNRVLQTWPPPHGYHKEAQVSPLGLSVRKKSPNKPIDLRSTPEVGANNDEGDLTDRYWRTVLKWACNYDTHHAWYQIRVRIEGKNKLYWVRSDDVDFRQVTVPYVWPVLARIDVHTDTQRTAAVLGNIDDYAPQSLTGGRTNSPTWWRIAYGGGHGWVHSDDVQAVGDVSGVPVIPAAGSPPVSTTLRYLRLRSWVTGLYLRTGPSTAFAAYRLLTDTSVWYEVVGQTATPPVWYKIRYSATFQGWVHSAYVELTERTIAIPAVTPPTPPAEKAPTGEAAPGTGSTSGSAAGDFRNLVTNPDGRWAVWKAGTTVTANFSSPRSPVQYYARQNPQPQFVLPVGFRPTAPVRRTVTGTQVKEDRTPVAQAPAATFDLTIGTNGAMRYVNNGKVDHLGYVSYSVTHLTWQTQEALVVPTQTGTLAGSGVYLNQQVNWGSSWKLTRGRGGTRVTGTFSCTRSPVDYHANGNPGRAAMLLLPSEYRPAADTRLQVTGAVRVNENGSDSTDTRKVNFWLTMQRDGYMWYDADASLKTQGVGYLRYTVNVAWTAAPLVPTAPQDLEVDDVAADEVELDWDAPAYDGGDAVDEYRVERYRNGSWREVEDDIARTRYDVADLSPYTTYTFRVRARNRAGWSEPSTALTVTTPRQAPAAPGQPTATATHAAVTLTWRAPATGGTVTGYRLQRRVGSGSWHTPVPDTRETTPGWVDRPVSPNTTYSYRVAAHHHGVWGPWSSAVAVTTAAAPTLPGAPTGLTVRPGTHHRLQLTWTVPTNTGGGVTGYQVERSPDATPRVWTAVTADTGSMALNWGDDDVAADTVVHYRVSARNSAGVGTPSAEAEGRTRPQLPLAATAAYPLTAHAEPRAAAAVTAIFHVYEAERVLDLVGQVPGGDGWWRVVLFGQASQGPFWLPATAGTPVGATTALPQPPSVPEGFTATLVQGQVTLTWTAPAAGVPVTGYRVWRQADDEAFAPLGNDLTATATTHTDRTVQQGHVYRYWLQALSAEEGPGVPTVTVALAVMATPVAPAAVTAVTAQATSTTLQLSWTRAATGGLPTGYRVQWRVQGATAAYAQADVTATTLTLTDLAPDTAYDIRITAFNQEGDAPVTTHTATTVPEAPGVPEAVAVAVTGQDATVSWQVPLTGGRPAAYHLQVKPQATAAWPATYTTVTGLSHRLTGLGYAVAHDLRVRAANAAGESAWVTTTFTTAAAPQLPAAPTGLTAAPGTDSPMQLTWTAPTTGGGAPAGYRIERSADVDPRVWTEIVADTGTTAPTWDDQGLAAATVYHYRVTGRNAAGLGPSSPEAAGTTRPQAALRATAPYPLTAHRWPETVAPVTHTWPAQDTTVTLDVAGQVRGTHGWYRVLRFGQAAHGPYWLPAAAITVTGATTAVPQAPGVPGTFQGTATAAAVTLTWSAPTTGGPVTGYRLWRQAGTGAWAVLGTVLAAATLTHTDTTGAPGTTYRYRVQARSAAGYGPRTAALTPATAGPVPAAPVLTLYAHPGRVTLIVRGASGTVQQALAWSGPVSGTTTLTGRSGYHRLVVPAGHTLTVRARSQDGAGRWSAWVTRTLTTR